MNYKIEIKITDEETGDFREGTSNTRVWNRLCNLTDKKPKDVIWELVSHLLEQLKNGKPTI
jgi:hypothetical protein